MPKLLRRRFSGGGSSTGGFTLAGTLTAKNRHLWVGVLS